jgi:GDPmannose 4,6-dehydratase
MKALIFGINGQDGYYLTDLLNLNGVDVIGVSRFGGDWIIGNVADYDFVEKTIKVYQPDYIFHFAANSTTQHFALFDNHHAISTGALNILESVKLHCAKAKVFLSGSATQFENIGLPIDENTPFEAKNPYSVARIHSTYAGRYYRQTFGIKVYIGYFFNHDSPLRTERHVNKKITAAVNRIANGSNEKLELGNVDVQKEFNYAGDIVEAMWMLINQNSFFEVVIGSGESHSIKEWAEYCFAKINKNWSDFVEIRKNFVPEYKILVSNPAIIKSLGWQPKVDFYHLADMMLANQ